MVKESEITKRQQEIVDAVKKIISSQGIENLTVREIARELDITDGALYRHFKSKNDIISFLIDDIERTLLGTVERAAEEGNNSLNKLKNVLFSHISYAEQRKGLTFLLINETLSLKDSRLQKKMYMVLDQYLKKIRDIISKGIEDKDFRKNMDVGLASVAFFGMVQSLVTIWSLSDYNFSITMSRIEDLFAIYKEGIILK